MGGERSLPKEEGNARKKSMNTAGSALTVHHHMMVNGSAVENRNLHKQSSWKVRKFTQSAKIWGEAIFNGEAQKA